MQQRVQEVSETVQKKVLALEVEALHPLMEVEAIGEELARDWSQYMRQS